MSLDFDACDDRSSIILLSYDQVPQANTTYTELSSEGAGQVSDLMKAVNSIPAYVERSSHFLAIVPTVSLLSAGVYSFVR